MVTTAWMRPQLPETLLMLSQCVPPPDEILVHVDAGKEEVARLIKEQFPWIRVLISMDTLGPGGSRNRLLQQATGEWVVSFDDDSAPIECSFFARLRLLIDQHPEVALFACRVLEPGDETVGNGLVPCRVTDFVGCGCVYRRRDFLETSGYVPLPLAYGMEEADLALRYHADGRVIRSAPDLLVLHRTDPQNRESPTAISASIANILLRAWLRYPICLLWVGVAQAMNRALWLWRRGFGLEILAGFARAPMLVIQHFTLRKPVGSRALISYLWHRRTGWRDSHYGC